MVLNKDNSWAQAISTAELCRIWGQQAQGKVNTWRQINLDWPERPLRFCAPGPDSGTFDCFNEAINGDKANAEHLGTLPIVGPEGIAVAPSLKTVQNGSYQPLSRSLFIYVTDQQMRSDDAIRRFVSFSVGDGLRFVEEAGYRPLPADTCRIVESKLYRPILGTSFGGDLPVGLSLGEALRRSFDDTRRPEFG